jgi:sugar phosphate permease
MLSSHLSGTEVAAPATASPPLRRSSRGGRSTRHHSHNYKWGVLGIGFAAQAAFSVAFQGIPVTGPLMQTAYHLTTGQLGLVLSFMSLGIAVSDVGWGILTDRVGERRILVLGLFGLAAALGMCAVFLVPAGSTIPAVALLSLGLLVAGALGGSVNGASGRAIMAWFQKNERGFAISVRVTAVPVGGAIGAATLPFVALHGGFRGVFVLLTVVSLVAAAVTYRWLDEPPIARPVAGRDGSPAVSATRSPLGVLNVWRVAIASGLLTCPQFVVLTFGAVFLHSAKGVGIGTIAVLLVAVQVLGAISRVWGGRWTDKRDGRLRRSLVKAQGWVITAGFLGVAIFERSPAIVVVVLLGLAGVVACGWHGVAYAEIAEIAGPERSGTALGLENTMVFSGAFITPVLIPIVLAGSSWSVTMLVLGAAPALLAVLLMPREERVTGADDANPVAVEKVLAGR